MRSLIFILGVVLIGFVFFAGCSSDSGNATNGVTTVPTATPIPTTTIPTTIVTPTPTPTPTAVPTPDPLGDNPNLVTIKTIAGVAGSQTVNVTVPDRSWELWYTADPLGTGGQDRQSTTGANSAVFPSLKIVVKDAATGTEIETVEPPGGIDTLLWQRTGDPRPWSKKFYEGNKAYVFDITGRHVKSYLIEVRVPKS
jgi:hypothetical protein